MAVHGTGGSCDGSSNGNVGSAGRDKGIDGGGKEKEGVLTWFSWGCAQMATCFALAGEAR
jgi:hypothetical protein